MSTSQTSPLGEQHAESPVPMSAVAALEHDMRWQKASDAQRVVLHRIAAQRDRLAAAEQARAQTPSLVKPLESVPADAPFAERLAVFAKLHPVASAAAAGLVLLLGPRKLIRYGGIAWPLISKFRRYIA